MRFFQLFLLFVLLSSFTKFSSNGYKPGDTAVDFKLKNVDGKFVSLSDYKKAKGFVVIFTCNHCPYAQMYEDRIIALNNKYGKDFPVIAINPNDPSVEPEDSPEEMKKRAKEKGFKFAYLFDEGQSVLADYGATKTPHVFLLDSKKVVKYIGAIDDSPQDASAVNNKFLENAIESLKKGQKIDPETTKALGCSVKFKKKK